MKITLTAVKHAAFASRETDCFSAKVIIDGVVAGEASNDGHGGCNNYHPSALWYTLSEHAKTLPILVTDIQNGDGTFFQMQPDADTIIGGLLAAHLDAKRMKRLCAKKVLFRKPGVDYKDGSWHTLLTPFSPAAKEQLVQKYGVAVEILNERI